MAEKRKEELLALGRRLIQKDYCDNERFAPKVNDAYIEGDELVVVYVNLLTLVSCVFDPGVHPQELRTHYPITDVLTEQ